MKILNRNVALQNLDSVTEATDVNDKVEILNRMIISLMDTAIPENTIRMYPSDIPWIIPKIKAQIRAEQKAFCRGDKIKYEQLRNKTSKLIRDVKTTYYRANETVSRHQDPAK